MEVTDANGCSSIETFNITTDLREIEAGVLATVYPNPSQGVFTVDIMGGIQGQVQYRVVDAQGRRVLNGQWNASEGFSARMVVRSGSWHVPSGHDGQWPTKLIAADQNPLIAAQ